MARIASRQIAAGDRAKGATYQPGTRRAVTPSAEARGTLRVALLAAPGTEMLDLLGPFQVFSTAAELFAQQHPPAAPIYRVEIITTSRRCTFETNCGVRIVAHRTLHQVRGGIDTLLIAGGNAIEEDRAGTETLRWVRQAAAGARRVGSVCTGALLLARAGLLDGRKATTHWNWCERLARRHPRVRVEPDPIYIRDGAVYTSAGITAGMDLALALVEEDYGSRLALRVARQLVLYLRRPGGQSQFSAALALQASDHRPLRDLHAWVLEHLDERLDVETLAEHVAMSPRNFARVFSREMGITPGKFVETLRVETARRRLEETGGSLKKIAQECGFGSAGTMRQVFSRVLGVAPAQYREHFRSSRSVSV